MGEMAEENYFEMCDGWYDEEPEPEPFQIKCMYCGQD